VGIRQGYKVADNQVHGIRPKGEARRKWEGIKMTDILIASVVLIGGLIAIKILVTINYYIDRINGIGWERPTFWIFRPIGNVEYWRGI
jgi:hypothetical protein